MVLSASVYMESAAQELNCTVEVNTSSVEGTYTSVFDNLKENITEYFNDTKWTNTQFSPNEKIDCRFFLQLRNMPTTE